MALNNSPNWDGFRDSAANVQFAPPRQCLRLAPSTRTNARKRPTTAPPPLAAREGLEPPTFALGKRCSILLSYRADRWGDSARLFRWEWLR